MSPDVDLELLQQLMRFEPVSSRSNRPIAEFIAERLQRAGATVELVAGEDDAFFNVVATIGPAGDDRAGLTLSGHLDVVPAEEPEWTGDPFALRQVDGNAIGRGSCDMLGSVALFVNLFRETDAKQLTAPLAVVLTFGEELGSIGAQRLADAWPGASALPMSCIVGEPTSLQVVRMHKGHLKMRITVAGRAAHSGSPHLGSNAIEAATPILAALSRLRAELETERPPNGEYFPEVPFVALNIARVRGGDALNVIPEQCVIEIGLRPLPGMDSQPLIERVMKCVNDASGSSPVEVQVINDNPPMETAENAAVHQTLCELTNQNTSLGVSYSSDGGIFGRALGMECVLFGPGSIEHAHRPDEFVPITEVARARVVVRSAIERMCMQPVSAT